MTRLSAGTLAGPLQGKRTSIPDRVPRQTRSSGEGLERASSSSASSSLTRDIGDPGWPGLLSSHNPPGAWDKSCHRAPAPLPDHSHCPVDGVPGGASGCASQSAGWTIFHPPCRSVPPCSHPRASCLLPTARPHAPPIPLLRDICARIAAFAFSPPRPHSLSRVCDFITNSRLGPIPIPHESKPSHTSTKPLTKRRRLRPRDWPGQGLSTETARRKKG